MNGWSTSYSALSHVSLRDLKFASSDRGTLGFKGGMKLTAETSICGKVGESHCDGLCIWQKGLFEVNVLWWRSWSWWGTVNFYLEKVCFENLAHDWPHESSR